jgi:hypothetical protein
MKATDIFTATIKAHLETVAGNDPLFAETFKKPNKNIDDCCTYILNEVKKSGRAGFADEEVYGMAVHYYDEDNLQPGKPLKCNVVVNHKVEGLKKQIEDTPAPVTKKVKKPLPVLEALGANQTSLF